MAGSTTNIGLIKPTYSEDADVAIINENMDTLDSTISALDNGLAIVSNNNTHGAITAGQYVYVRNHGSLAEGMYTANSNIAANATLSSSNLTAVTGGGLNDLAGDISALNGKFVLTTTVRAEFQVVPSTNRYLIWLYDQYASASNSKAYRIDLNGTAKTAKFERVENGTLSELFSLAINDNFKGTTLPSNSDLLNAPVGVWSYLSATGLSNTPCSNGLVRVYEAPSSGWKFIYVNDPTDATKTYVNIKTGSGWGGWKKYTGAAV